MFQNEADIWRFELNGWRLVLRKDIWSWHFERGRITLVICWQSVLEVHCSMFIVSHWALKRCKGRFTAWPPLVTGWSWLRFVADPNLRLQEFAMSLDCSMQESHVIWRKKVFFRDWRVILILLKTIKVFIHVSTPCSSGSPLRNFDDGHAKLSDQEWFELFPSVRKYMKLGNETSFKLPWFNRIWNFSLCQKTLKDAKHEFVTQVRLCRTEMVSKLNNPVGKVLGFTSSTKVFIDTLKQFAVCTCKVHAGFNEVTWTETGFYNQRLAKAIVEGARKSFEAWWC